MATCDLAQLLADGKCFACLNERQANIVMAQLLCASLAAAEGIDDPDAEVCLASYEDSFAGVDGVSLPDPPWTKLGAFPLEYSSGRAVSPPDGLINCGGYVNTFQFAGGYVQAQVYGTDYQALIFRFNPLLAAHWYEVAITPADGTLTLIRGVTELDSALITYAPGALLRVDGSGSRIVVQYNGATVIDYDDTDPDAALGAGYAGLFAQINEGLEASFDNFKCCQTQ